MDIPWNAYDPNWVPLPDDRRKLWTPEQSLVYDHYTDRNAWRSSPAAFGKHVRTDWLDFPHITYISNIIAQFVFGQLLAPNGRPAKRLFLTMPPRHGKSFLLSQIVPAWYLTLYPNRHVILTTYEAEFAASWGGKVRDILAEYGHEFGLALNESTKAKARWGLAKPFLGGMITAGMGGPITGMGGGLLIGDDWVKNSQEANSETWRNNAWDWYNTTFRTRGQKDLSDKNAPPPLELWLMTRWHEDDPPGRMLEKLPDDTVVIHLPALAVEDDPLGRAPGEALCPEIITADELIRLRDSDARSFEALYQGNPTIQEGGLFSASHFREWSYSHITQEGTPATSNYVLYLPEGGTKTVPVKDCVHFTTADLAISKRTSADFTVFSTWASTPDRDLLLIRQFRDRIEESEHLSALQKFHDEGNAALAPHSSIRTVGIEKATYGISLISNALRHSNMPIRALDADSDKYTRALPAANATASGKVYLPKGSTANEAFISECTGFPNGKHDDQVDTFAYAVLYRDRFLPQYGAGKRFAQESSEVSSHVEKIAARNAKIRKQRRGNGMLY